MGGGDTAASSDENSFLDQDISYFSSFSGVGLSMKVEDDTVKGSEDEVFQEYEKWSHGFSSASLDLETNQRKRNNVYREILQSYDELQTRSKRLEEAKTKILGYTPGRWIEKAAGRKLSEYDLPRTISLILIGPKGSGKSSLINRISRVFEDDKFAAERAQVSYNSSVGDGTLFLKQYMIPRGSTSFCLYDTRSLSEDINDNYKILKHWMTKGVSDGELVIRDSDNQLLRTRIRCKAHNIGFFCSEIRKVNFVIFVVNGLSVLKSLENEEDADMKYLKLISSAFNCSYLSFRDDKPLLVVTHGDLLSHFDRARVRLYLGELLGIPPTKQIFDITESYDPGTDLAIVDMLRYSLEHADKNLPHKRMVDYKDRIILLSGVFVLLLAIIPFVLFLPKASNGSRHSSASNIHYGHMHRTSSNSHHGPEHRAPLNSNHSSEHRVPSDIRHEPRHSTSLNATNDPEHKSAAITQPASECKAHSNTMPGPKHSAHLNTRRGAGPKAPSDGCNGPKNRMKIRCAEKEPVIQWHKIRHIW